MVRADEIKQKIFRVGIIFEATEVEEIIKEGKRIDRAED